MATYIVRRLLVAVPIFFGITVIVFLLLALAPGDPVSAFIRPALRTNAAMRAAIIARYGLDQPLPLRSARSSAPPATRSRACFPASPLPPQSPFNAHYLNSPRPTPFSSGTGPHPRLS